MAYVLYLVPDDELGELFVAEAILSSGVAAHWLHRLANFA